MAERIKYLNLPDIAGRVSDIRSAGQRRRLVGMQIEDIEGERATKKTRKNVMAEYYDPPGTKSIEPGQDVAGNAMGGYDWQGAAAALAAKGDIKGSLATSKAGREAKRSAADLKIKLLQADEAERDKVMKNLTLLGRLSRQGLAMYDKAIASGRTDDQAIQDMDEWYDSAGEQLINLGISASDIPQKFDPVKARGALALVGEAGALDIEKKKVGIAKTREETAKIKREAGGVSTNVRAWHSNAKGVLGSLYGQLTDTGGYVIDPPKMKEYRNALTLLNKYRKQGLDPNEAGVRASEEASKIGTVDTLPEGSVFYGTEGGVNLYKAPDGKIYKEE